MAWLGPVVGVYGGAESQQKYHTGEIIVDLKTHLDLLWLMRGDLNEVFYHCEKQGGPLRAQAHINDFRNAFIDNDLRNLGFLRYDFAWCGDDVMEEHLDRFCATTEWFVTFPEAQVTNPRINDVISSAWRTVSCSDSIGGLLLKIEKCLVELLRWNKEHFDNVQTKIWRLETQLSNIGEIGH
ncbi:hypothetical protein Cgig2_023107 [Carnegiea gigantea]|uniref:Uncharacterized protein n=1 Tax=Carnegiea gigantea TaxID=171969 RepID=A0A9Q1GLK4_9CARY|nr:hypothetical protein Cgig2_023107 [Carnegiea gigantea]